MSIWTELLFLHGHIATPLALALATPCTAAPAAACAPSTAAPATPAAPTTGGEPRWHPLRGVGQLP